MTNTNKDCYEETQSKITNDFDIFELKIMKMLPKIF